MKAFKFLSLAFFISQSTCVIAGASNTYNVAAAACVPTGQTISQGTLFNSAGEASFKTGGFGEIILTCPVPQSLIRAKSLNVKYRDDFSLAYGSKVVVALRKKRIDIREIGKSITPSVESVVAADSDKFLPPGPSPEGYRDLTSLITQTGSEYIFDHDHFFYYIQVNMIKPGASFPLTVAFVSLI